MHYSTPALKYTKRQHYNVILYSGIITAAFFLLSGNHYAPRPQKMTSLVPSGVVAVIYMPAPAATWTTIKKNPAWSYFAKTQTGKRFITTFASNFQQFSFMGYSTKDILQLYGRDGIALFWNINAAAPRFGYVFYIGGKEEKAKKVIHVIQDMAIINKVSLEEFQYGKKKITVYGIQQKLYIAQHGSYQFWANSRTNIIQMLNRHTGTAPQPSTRFMHALQKIDNHNDIQIALDISNAEVQRRLSALCGNALEDDYAYAYGYLSIQKRIKLFLKLYRNGKSFSAVPAGLKNSATLQRFVSKNIYFYQQVDRTPLRINQTKAWSALRYPKIITPGSITLLTKPQQSIAEEGRILMERLPVTECAWLFRRKTFTDKLIVLGVLTNTSVSLSKKLFGVEKSALAVFAYDGYTIYAQKNNPEWYYCKQGTVVLLSKSKREIQTTMANYFGNGIRSTKTYMNVWQNIAKKKIWFTYCYLRTTIWDTYAASSDKRERYLIAPFSKAFGVYTFFAETDSTSLTLHVETWRVIH